MNKGLNFKWAAAFAGFLCLACVVLLASFNIVHAEENVPPTTAAPSTGSAAPPTFDAAESGTPNDLDHRRKLARELHDIKHVKDQIRETIAGVAKSLPPVEQEDFKKYMELKIDFDALEQKSIDYTAEIYTADELQAMVDFFGSREGRSAEVKGDIYAEKFGAEVQKTIDQAMMAAKFDNMNSLPQSLPTGPLSP